jgi:signal transduction histidine kinase
MLKGRSPLVHLLHALNQPLTGLQCSLELAVAGPRPNEQYVRTLREALELTGRMRILVEAIREVADAEPPDAEEREPLLLDDLLRSTVTDLLPVAETRGVHLLLVSRTPLPVRADRRSLAALLFRLLDSALSLARPGSDLRIVVAPDREQAALVVSWTAGPPPEHSPFSRPELGLLIARAGWEREGAEWTHTRTGTNGAHFEAQSEKTCEACTVRLPLAPALAPL